MGFRSPTSKGKKKSELGGLLGSYPAPPKPTNDQISKKVREGARKHLGAQLTDADVKNYDRALRRKFGKNLPGKGLRDRKAPRSRAR